MKRNFSDVTKDKQRHSIGRTLIEFVFQRHKPKILVAETDATAVGFYRKCGFDIISLSEKYPNCIRYLCGRK